MKKALISLALVLLGVSFYLKSESGKESHSGQTFDNASVTDRRAEEEREASKTGLLKRKEKEFLSDNTINGLGPKAKGLTNVDVLKNHLQDAQEVFAVLSAEELDEKSKNILHYSLKKDLILMDELLGENPELKQEIEKKELYRFFVSTQQEHRFLAFVILQHKGLDEHDLDLAFGALETMTEQFNSGLFSLLLNDPIAQKAEVREKILQQLVQSVSDSVSDAYSHLLKLHRFNLSEEEFARVATRGCQQFASDDKLSMRTAIEKSLQGQIRKKNYSLDVAELCQ